MTTTATPSATIPTLDWDGLNRIQYYGFDKDVYDPEFYRAICAEKTFREIGKREFITNSELGRAVGLGRTACPLCGWVQGIPSRRTIPLLHEGVETHVPVNFMVRCSCYLCEAIHQRWSGPKTMVSERYRETFLATLAPTSHILQPFAVQQRVIDCLRSNPHDSYLMCGKSGTGKTTYATALFAHSLKEWALWAFTKQNAPEGTWRIETHTLLAQHMDWNRRVDALAMNPMTGEQEVTAPTPPMVTRAKIFAARQAGFRPRLFLDELDKIVLSAAKLTALFDLVDAVYACRGQLVVCSNMTVRDVSVLLGDRVGVAVVRRIKEATEVDADGTTTSSRILDFFAENPFATYRQHLSAEQDSDTPESGANQSDGNEDVGIYV